MGLVIKTKTTSAMEATFKLQYIATATFLVLFCVPKIILIIIIIIISNSLLHK